MSADYMVGAQRAGIRIEFYIKGASAIIASAHREDLLFSAKPAAGEQFAPGWFTGRASARLDFMPEVHHIEHYPLCESTGARLGDDENEPARPSYHVVVHQTLRVNLSEIDEILSDFKSAGWRTDDFREHQQTMGRL